MKFVFLFIAAVLFVNCNGDRKVADFTVDFEKSTYAEAMEKAQQMNRLLLVDFYSDT